MASVKVNYAKDGSIISYRLRADLGRDTQGKQIVKTRTIKSSGALTPKKELREMQRQADEWERSMKEGLAPVQEKTFKQFVEIDFFQVHVHSGELKESTMEFYRNMAPRTIDYFGNMELTKIGSLDIEKFLNSLRTVTQENGKPLSARRKILCKRISTKSKMAR